MNITNPSPSESPTDKPAGFFSRLEAFIIDLLLILIASLTGVAMIGLIIRFFLRPLFDLNLHLARYSTLVASIILVGYYMFFWALLGSTPGKLLLGLKITRRDGRRLGLGRAIIRFIGYWISAIPLFLGFIWILFDRRREGWHDKLAGTHVIYTWKKPKNKSG